jgi:uncharacterized protein (UPF0335 family)
MEQTTATAEKLKSTIERIIRLEEEKQAIADDIKEIKNEAKHHGFDVKIITAIIRLLKKPTQKRVEEQQLMELYLKQIGIQE